MKKKFSILLASAIAAVGIVGGTVTAFAAVRTQGDSKQETYTVDDAVYLKWGANSLGIVNDLSSPVIRQVVVDVPSTSLQSSQGSVRLNLALAQGTPGEGKTALLDGLSVEVSDEAFAPGVSADYTLTKAAPSQNIDNAIAGFSTAKTYYLRISLNEETFLAAQGGDATKVLSAVLTATLSHVAA